MLSVQRWGFKPSLGRLILGGEPVSRPRGEEEGRSWREESEKGERRGREIFPLSLPLLSSKGRGRKREKGKEKVRWGEGERESGSGIKGERKKENGRKREVLISRERRRE